MGKPKFFIRKKKGEVKISLYNTLLRDVDELSEIEFWEARLEKLNEDFLVVYRLKKRKKLYTIYCNTRLNGNFYEREY